ncbi:hypothetical protein DXG03_007517 [Asterophora parasitica]|uniref:WLM domain-containing protein n=1 Tax=Asterophora parasitica TaxID=117018 RepID=A0A9P7KAR9_9AGAR|nr:hypothetical protein DXG03_007517 [Asterophora parasitica]
MSMSSPFLFTIVYRGNSQSLSLLPDTTLSALQAQIEELTNVPPALQKLLSKGKNLLASNAQSPDETTLAQAGFRSGMKIQMLGSTSQEVRTLHTTESEQRKREQILRERALKAPTKARPEFSPFRRILTERHPSAPIDRQLFLLKPLLPGALALLTKLAQDPAIQHVMRLHQFSVGVLTEIDPHENPGPEMLLGLNVNVGQAIKLRLRTDDYDGFRLYRDVRRFRELNSQLNREVADFERAAAQGAHYLHHHGDVYEPSSELEAEAHVHILGGGDTSYGGDSREEQRRRVLDATMARLRKEEQEQEKSCGTRPTQA